MSNEIPAVIVTPERPQPYDVLRDMVNFSGMQSTFIALSAIAGEKAAMYREAKNTYYADCWEDMQRAINDLQDRAPRL